MNRKLFTYIFLLVAISIWGQTDGELKVKINTIKKSSAYVYAEATQKDKKEAYDMAQDILYQRINEYLAKEQKKDGSLTKNGYKKKYNIANLTVSRGDMFRVFLYVKKEDFFISENGYALNASGKEPTANGAEHEVIDDLLALKTFAEMKQKLAELKKKGKILSYQKYMELDKPEQYYLIVFDKQGKILAILTKGVQRKNLRTHSYDTISNYKGCGAVGVKIREGYSK